MPVSLVKMRELLLPGLLAVPYPSQWDDIFAKDLLVEDYERYTTAYQAFRAAYPPLPAVPLGAKAALALGAAAAVIKNPEVTRRWFFGLWRSK